MALGFFYLLNVFEKLEGLQWGYFLYICMFKSSTKVEARF